TVIFSVCPAGMQHRHMDTHAAATAFQTHRIRQEGVQFGSVGRITASPAFSDLQILSDRGELHLRKTIQGSTCEIRRLREREEHGRTNHTCYEK
ncbi:hypothetical protein JOQ06_000253, partial [Pogonophryne albipinna]